MSIFSNINVFDDHLMYHKTTRSYLEMSGNPEINFQKRKKASKKSEWKCVLEMFCILQQIQRMLEPTTRQNKYNMLAYSWKIKFYDTLHITEKLHRWVHFVFCEFFWLGTKGGDFVSQLFLLKIAFCSEARKRSRLLQCRYCNNLPPVTCSEV